MYSSLATRAYSRLHRAKLLFSAPDRRIFWIPLSTAKFMPLSSASSFILSRVILTCARDAVTLITTVARITSREGQTSAGAKLKICVT